MSPRTRALLAIVGIIIIAISIVAIAYAFAPIQNVREQVPLAPTLFLPPQ